MRDACGDETVYLFLDNCSVHKSSRSKMAKLNIVPVWNVVYKPEYNLAIENYWAQLKAHFRPLLLSKMLKQHRAKDTPLLDALKQSIREVSTSAIPSFC